MPEKPPTAVAGEGHPPYEEEFRVIGHILERDAEPIMERWYERATEEQVHADSGQRSAVMNELLHMLQSLGQQLKEQDRPAMTHAADIAREHGKQRSGLGWDIVELVRDYEILHGVMLEHLGQMLDKRLTYRQAMIIATVVDGTTGSAVEAFSEVMQQRLEQRAEQLRRLAMELAQTEHRERRRLAQLLHDNLQQLLVAIQLQVDGLPHEADRPRFLKQIQHVQNLVSEASEASRSLTGQLSPPLLYEVGLVAALRWLARQMLKNHNLKIHLQTDDQIEVPDEATRVTLFEGARELLLNVAKHAQAGEAWVRVEQTEQQVRLTVEDHGAGYESGQPARESDPSGFGLANIRERMQWLGGSMHEASAPGEGTRTVLEAPRQPAPESKAEPDAANASAPGCKPAGNGAASPEAGSRCRVLVVDDHHVVRQGLVRLITEAPDFEVIAEAGDGVEAVEMAHEHRPDVIVMDVTMPRMDGVEATRRIAEELPDIRIIGLSLHAEEDMAQRMRNAGAHAYLNKSGPMEELLAAMRDGRPA
ncbi:response regulator [Phycisphaerales bacterium AB-hyl4]|uniref:Response regulator n=1 Tax=Natronomicrosphaera hydrolytica TaxID=3242702 RepID=A0ABV4U2E2_9BACT